MKKYIVPVILSMLMIMPGNQFMLQGKLKDFADDVKKEEGRDSGSSSSSDSSGSDGCADACMEAAVQVLAAIWVAHNYTVYYGSYPYSEDKTGKFARHEELPEENTLSDEDGHEGSDKARLSDNLKRYYYTIESAGQWARDDGSGFITAVRGKFWKYFGPDLEARALWDGDDYLALYSLGLNMAVVQTGPFLMDFYLQASLMRGVLDRSGISYGTTISIYPVKPVSLFVRVGGVSYEHIDFLDVEGRLGFMINRFELFAGYRHLASGDASLGGPLAGVKVYF